MRGRGQKPAEVLIIGEAPGKVEDLRGLPFIGPSGRVLQAAIRDATMRAELAKAPTIFITNTVWCRPCDGPGYPNRPPDDKEIFNCMPHVKATVYEVNPQHIILLGKVAQKSYAKVYPGSFKLPHPSYLLRLGGTECPEYRQFVAAMSEIFKKIKRSRSNG